MAVLLLKLLVFATVSAGATSTTAEPKWLHGFTFGSEGWAHPNASYDSSWVHESLEDLKETGADTVTFLSCVLSSILAGSLARDGLC